MLKTVNGLIVLIIFSCFPSLNFVPSIEVMVKHLLEDRGSERPLDVCRADVRRDIKGNVHRGKSRIIKTRIGQGAPKKIERRATL